MPRKLKRRAGMAVAIGFAGLFVFGYLRCANHEAHSNDIMREGFTALDDALRSKKCCTNTPKQDACEGLCHGRSWEQAKESFREGARQSMLDTYPLFCLHVTEQLEAAEPLDESTIDSLDDVPPALAAGRRDEVREAVVSLTANSPDDAERARATFWLRFLGDLEVAGARRTANPPAG